MSSPRRLWWSLGCVRDMVGEVADALGEQRDLHLRRAGIGVVDAVLGDGVLLGSHRVVLLSPERAPVVTSPGAVRRRSITPTPLGQPRRTGQGYGRGPRWDNRYRAAP